MHAAVTNHPPIGTEPPRGDDPNPLMRHLPRRFVAPVPPRMEELEAMLAEMLLLGATASAEASLAVQDGDLDRFSIVQTQAAALPHMRRNVEGELLRLRVEHAKASAELVFAHEKEMRRVKAERLEVLHAARAGHQEASQAEARLSAYRSHLEGRVRDAEEALGRLVAPTPASTTEVMQASINRSNRNGADQPPPPVIVPMDRYQDALRREQRPMGGLKTPPAKKGR